MLGMGDDGHTASLFPGTEALRITNREYVANWVPQHDTWRLTATFRLIAAADLVLFVVTGSRKAPMIAAVAAGADVPSAQVTARTQVRWILDQDAAAGL